jgi:hypothetical protein
MKVVVRKHFPFIILFSVLFSSVYTQTADPVITKLFRDSYHAIKAMRQSNGIYLDALAIHVDNKPGAIVANGVGLIPICIADSMYRKTGDAINWESDGAAMVKSTLSKFIIYKNAHATNSKGLFRRYFDSNTGFEFGSWGTEYSTIDNAIFAIGLIFCRNYFSGDTTIVNKANSLLHTMDFTAAISSDSKQLYMVLDQNGSVSAPIGAYNEYMLVAWLAKNVSTSHPGYVKSNLYWDTYYRYPKTASITHRDYWGYELISDGGFLSDFIPQFTYYYCHYFRNNSDYMFYFDNARKADSLWWTKVSPGIASYEWGLGAGENPGGGYSANAIDWDSSQIVSPHIIAGFIPVYAQGKNDLKTLYNNGTGVSVYALPDDNTRKVLWRYSRKSTALRCPYIQAVDFSTMLYGLATLPEYLGTWFFDRYNDVSKNSTPDKTDQKMGSSNISVFPVPAKDKVTIEIHGMENHFLLSIQNIDGKKMIQYPIKENKTELDISNLKSGVYFLQLLNDEIFQIRKIIKE